MVDYSKADKASFRLDGKPATFTPSGGSPTSCIVQVRRPFDVSHVGVSGISQQNTHILVPAFDFTARDGTVYAAVEDPRGGTFTAIAALGAGLVWKVSEADRDEEGNVWTCAVRPTT